MKLVGPLGRDPGADASADIDDPDVEIPALLRISNGHGDPIARGRNPNVLVVGDGSERARLAPLAIHPHEAAVVRPEAVDQQVAAGRRFHPTRVGQEPDVARHSDGVALRGRAPGVESLREERPFAGEEQIARRSPDRARIGLKEDASGRGTRVEIAEGDG